jgi:hypothetical protein
MRYLLQAAGGGEHIRFESILSPNNHCQMDSVRRCCERYYRMSASWPFYLSKLIFTTSVFGTNC